MARNKISTFTTTGLRTIFTGKLYVFQTGILLIFLSGSRQPMSSNIAWQRHGCYKLGSQQYFNMPLEKSLLACHDDWNSRDHFDPTSNTRLMIQQFNRLRTLYGALQDGFNLVQRGNWTYYIQRPGSNGTQTEMGLWSVSRSALTGYQTVGGIQDQVWMLYTNENTTRTYTYNCTGSLWISTPYESGVVVKNLIAPFESYTLEESLSSYNNDSQPPYFGCLPSITMESYGFKVLVPITEWTPPAPVITSFTPGHDYRILANPGDTNATTVDIVFEFNVAMDCDSVTNSITLVMSSGQNNTPTIVNPQCNAVTPSSTNSSAITSVWSWSGTITNMADGILEITVNNPSAGSGNGTNGTTGVCRFFT